MKAALRKSQSFSCFVGVFVITIAASVSRALASKSEASNDSQNKSTEVVDLGPRLRAIACTSPRDCKDVDGTYCDADIRLCLCKPDYPVTDTNECYKESKYDEFCQLDIQCQSRDKNTKCNRDFNLCECQPRFIAQSYTDGQFWCVQPSTSQTTDTSIGSYVDPTLFGIMGGLALMFIVMCVVLRLFANAQFAENRSIFNTPNPRLMNVSLLKDSKLANASTKKKASTRTASISSGAGGNRISQIRKDSLNPKSGADEPAHVSVGTSSGNASNNRKRNHAAPKRRASSVVHENEDNILLEMKDSQA